MRITWLTGCEMGRVSVSRAACGRRCGRASLALQNLLLCGTRHQVNKSLNDCERQHKRMPPTAPAFLCRCLEGLHTQSPAKPAPWLVFAGLGYPSVKGTTKGIAHTGNSSRVNRAFPSIGFGWSVVSGRYTVTPHHSAPCIRCEALSVGAGEL